MAQQRFKSYDISELRTRLASCFPPVVPRHTATAHYYERTDSGRVTASVTTKQSFVGKSYLKQWAVNVGIDLIEANFDRLNTADWPLILAEARQAHTGSLEQSADIGTTAHKAIDRYLRDWISKGSRAETSAAFLGSNSTRGEEIAACRSFDRLIKDLELIPVASEISIWYETLRDCFAGNVDAIFILRSPRQDREGNKECTHDYARQPSGVLWCAKAGCGREVTESLILIDWKTSNSIREKSDYAQQSEAYARAIEKAAGIRFKEVWIVRLSKARAEYEICKVADRKQAWKEFIAISRAYDIKEVRGEQRSLLVPLLTREVINI